MRAGSYAFVVLLAAGCGSGSAPAAAVAALRVEITGYAHGRLLNPGESTVLEVVVRDAAGDPVADVAVRFVGPDAGPGGTFAAPAPEGAFASEVRTDAAGEARAELTANGECGAFLVEVRVAGADTVRSFAVTCAVGLPAPTRTAADARAIAEEEVFGDEAGSRARLYGPILLPAGARVEDGDGGLAGIDLAAAGWFFWVDLEPGRYFEHPTRLVVVPADAADGTVSTVETRRWADLLRPGEAVQELLPPSRRNALPPPMPGGPRRLAHEGPVGEVQDACSIAIAGTTEPAMQQTVADVDHFFTEHLRVRDHQTLDRGATLAEFEAMLDHAKAEGCSKVFIYIVGHGVGDPTLPPAIKFSDGPRKMKRHRDLADEIAARFANTGVEVCLIFESCFAARAIPEYQGKGLAGAICVSANFDHPAAYMDADENIPAPFSIFTDRLLWCWSSEVTPATDPDGDGAISLPEANAWADADVEAERTDSRFRIELLYATGGEVGLPEWLDLNYAAQAPRTVPVVPEATPWSVPDAEVFEGKLVSITIPRPPENSEDPVRTPMALEVSVVDDGIASPLLEHVTMNYFQDSVQIEIFGHAPGSTEYIVRSRAGNDFFEGRATVTVREPFVVLDYDHGPYPAGTEIGLSRIGGGGITTGEPGCFDGAAHLHGDDVLIDGLGPYADEVKNGCGHGRVYGLDP